MNYLSNLFDLWDQTGERRSFSKMIAFSVTVCTLSFLAFGVIDSEGEAMTIGALIAAAYGLDGWKTHIKTNGTHAPDK